LLLFILQPPCVIYLTSNIHFHIYTYIVDCIEKNFADDEAINFTKISCMDSMWWINELLTCPITVVRTYSDNYEECWILWMNSNYYSLRVSVRQTKIFITQGTRQVWLVLNKLWRIWRSLFWKRKESTNSNYTRNNNIEN